MALTIDVGKIKFTWQGTYDAATTYEKDDVVYHDGSAWVCVIGLDSFGNQQTVTGVTPSSSATAEWNKMAQGSDLGAITGLAAGSIIYYNGSDFINLGVGSQGQALLVGAGNALEWGDPKPAGSVMEIVTGVCNGGTQTVSSGTYTLPLVTTYQNFSTSYTTVTGSEFAYTPPAGATRVIYEFQWMYEDLGQGGISHHKFFIDNVEVQDARTNLAHQYSTSAHGQLLQNYKWIIDCNASADDAGSGSFTSWTSSKTMKWQARNYSGSYTIRAHFNTWWDGTSASGTNQFRVPTITITAIK